ncbi:MAG: PorP/SprF family type IX secretion system membrane protein [Flavobacteriales bacterium]|nr:PorP/SprF family type IX secretion system membrane protein [Flavobacteriales bacterium]
MKKSILTFILLSFFAVQTFGQQIPMFSSYTLNKYLINPSYAGAKNETNIYGINRVQYAGFDGAPVTYMLTGDAGFKSKSFGLGGLLYSDRNSLIAQNGFQLTYAYAVKLNERLKLGFGLNAGMVQWNLNLDQLRVDDVSEAVISTYPSNATTFRSDFGLRLSGEKFEFGISLPQVVSSKVKYSDYLKNTNGTYASNPHYIVNAGYNLSVNEALKINPMVVVRGSQDIAPQIDVIGLFDWKDKAFAAVGYRTNYAFSVGAGLKFAKGIKVGYMFDRPVNDISKFAVGSHEIVVGFKIGGKSTEDKSEPANGLTKDSEAKLKDKLEKDISAKLAQEMDAKINKAVEEKVAKEINSKQIVTTPTDDKNTKTTPGNSATLSKDDVEKIKKDLEENLKKQLEENMNKLVEEKVKLAVSGIQITDSKKDSKEDSEAVKKQKEEKMRKEIEDKLAKDMADKINKSVEAQVEKEMKKSKEVKDPNEYKMTKTDKALIDSLNARNEANTKRIAELEFMLANFPESDRIENSQMRMLGGVAHQNDITLKSIKSEYREKFDKAKDVRDKKGDEANEDEALKFVIVLAAFQKVEEAQDYVKLAAQTFEFPDCKILKPDALDGWYLVYNKSFNRKKDAMSEFEKVFPKKTNTPKYAWLFVNE